MNLKFEGNQVTYFFKLNHQYFFTVFVSQFAIMGFSVVISLL